LQKRVTDLEQLAGAGALGLGLLTFVLSG